MTQNLRIRLTVLYAGLFTLALTLVSALVIMSVQQNARRQVEDELIAGGAVFDRIWALNQNQLAEGARLLARDFGFREALATGDAPTVSSALDNLKDRLQLDRAFIVQVDGRTVAASDMNAEAVADLWNSLDEGVMTGVMDIGGVPHQAIAEPILAPQLLGWVVFAVRLDREELASLEKLAAIPLSADVMLRQSGGKWVSTDGAAVQPSQVAFAEASLKEKQPRPSQLSSMGGETLALAKPLGVIGHSKRAVLVLRYPLALAFAPANRLMGTIMGVGFMGLAILALGSWLLARSITRPVSALAEAARRLSDGEQVQVEVDTSDEIGRLAESFNAMALGIRDRERRITDMALTDAETGLPNRRALEKMIQDADPTQRFVAVMGVDRFLQVRAALGYRVAGVLLQRLAQRVSAVRSDATCARISSDRLAFIMKAADSADALLAVEVLCQALSAPVQLDGLTVDADVTIGVASVVDDHPGPPIERASIALDQARAARKHVALFNAEAYGDPASKLSLMSEMQAALVDQALFLAYQPKLNLRTGEIAGLEALVRWHHPVRGMVAPDLFIPLAEETGHIRSLTRWTLEQAVRDQAAMRAADHDLPVSVNLSGRLLGELDFTDETIALISGAQAKICLEITETAVIDNPERALQSIERLRASGVAVSIDDYGSGLSSLSYLKQIQADELKIDKAFVTALDRNARDALLVRSTVELAHSLGLKTVAEGVETAEVLAALQALGCDQAQGYFISRPLPLAEVLAFLADQEPVSAGRTVGGRQTR